MCLRGKKRSMSTYVGGHLVWKSWIFSQHAAKTAQPMADCGRCDAAPLGGEKTGRRSEENRFSIPAASGSKGHLFNLKTITLLKSLPNHRLKHIPHGLSCSPSVCCMALLHTLTSPPEHAWPLPFYPHSRDCERHTKQNLWNRIINWTQITHTFSCSFVKCLF